MELRVDELLGKRCSIRAYTDESVSLEMVRSLVENAITSPSPSNSQPVRYFHLTSNRIRDLLREDMEKGYSRLLELAKSADKPKKAKTLIRYYWRFSQFMLQVPDLFCVGNVEVSGFYGKLSETGIDSHHSSTPELDITVGISVMAFIMKAESLGLGTCVLTAPLLFTEKWLELPELGGMTPKCFLTCGYPDELPEKTPRKSFEEIYRKI